MLQRRFLPLLFIAFIILSAANWGCSKLDTTDIGSDLIPAVDNVNTFADTLSVVTTQATFADTPIITRTEDHVLGVISNDPFFGTTQANVYMQLKPTFYPYYFGNLGDTITNPSATGTKFDSVVLCLNYKGFWGDSTQNINLEVREIVAPYNKWDSIYEDKFTNFKPNTGPVIGSANVDVKKLRNWIIYKDKRDSAYNQIRIPLSASFANKIFNKNHDSALNNPGVFTNDSLFRIFQNGLAVIATGGNGLIRTNLADTNTKLEIHFTRKNGGALDTGYSSFKLGTNFLNTVVFPSSTCNFVERKRTGFPVATPNSNFIYFQSTPGTYANLTIPGLSTYSNRIIHRAELIVEQVPDISDTYLTPPDYLYLDLKDTGSGTKWKPIYYDLNPVVNYDPDFKLSPTFYPGNVDLVYYGGYLQENAAGKYYSINISRYVQQIATRKINNYNLRLFSPYTIYYPQYSNLAIPYYNKFANGRVRVGSGTHPTRRMKLRVIYSKI
jgi:Domain of unknown function (DUF4270)